MSSSGVASPPPVLHAPSTDAEAPPITPEPPARGYLELLGIYGTGVLAYAAWFRASGRELPERIDGRDLALLTVAAHKLSRTLTKDRILRPLRRPFTVLEGDAGPGEVSESPRQEGDGLRHALGDLLVCPYCAGMWSSTAFMAGRLAYPRTTRAVASVFCCFFGSQVLQVAYKRLESVNG